MTILWLALITALVLIVVSAIYGTRQGLKAFRAFKQLGRSVGGELERIEQASGEIERHLALAAEGGTRLAVSLARLSTSRGRLNVLTSAIADARATVGLVTGIVPRK